MDWSLSKMALIALVGLVVIGPKDLPRVARKAGQMWGRLMTMRAKILDELHHSGSPFEEARQATAEAVSSLRKVASEPAWASHSSWAERVGKPLDDLPVMPKYVQEGSRRVELKARARRRVQRLLTPNRLTYFNNVAKPGRYYR